MLSGDLTRACLIAAAALAIFDAGRADAAPAARARVKVVSMDGKPAQIDEAFLFGSKDGTHPVRFKGSDWSEWLPLPFAVGGAPVTVCSIRSQRLPAKVFPPMKLKVECAIEGSRETSKSEAELYGPQLGFILWKDSPATGGGISHVDTFAGHDRRVYGPAMKEARIPAEQRPKKIVVGERFIGGDQDLVGWREGIGRLAGMGFNAIHNVPPPLAGAAQRLGFTRVWGAVYNPPGYAFNFASDRHEQFVKFVEEQIAPTLAAGWRKEQIAFWFTSDEPGWYYPATYRQFNNDTAALAAFHAYLRDRGLTPPDLGNASWDEIKLIGRKQYTGLPSRRLFYWSNRFVPWASSRFFAEVAEAYEQAIRPGVPVIVNFNNFFGAFYQPGPVGNNRDKNDPNAAMGQHDWLEFGRERGTTCIATEDWFGDADAGHWSFYAARLRSAAELGGVGFGALVIPRVSGQTPMGMPQKVLSLVGNGVKTIKFFTFGPEYNFPGNCYSENPAVFKPLSTAMRMVARAEDLLYPGKPRRPQVAILTPQSAQLWDLEDQQIAQGLPDATNSRVFFGRMHYLSEVFTLHVALLHSGVPVRFVDEEALSSPDSLKDCRVLYISAPDLPAECVEGVLRWVSDGGTLVTVAGTGLFDRYHQPAQMLARASGIAVKAPLRPLVDEDHASAVAAITDAGDLTAMGPLEELTLADARPVAHFSHGAAAVTEKALGQGRIIHFAIFPGFSYVKNGNDAWRQMIVRPVHDAAVALPATVNVTKVEAPVLYSETGAVATLLNWSGKEQEVELSVAVDKPVRQVESVLRGRLKFRADAGRVKLRVHLAEVDVILLRY